MTEFFCYSFPRLRERVASCCRAASRRTTLGLLFGLLALAARAQRPQLELALQAASSTLSDPTYLYVDAGATTGFDSQLDADKIINPNGLNLASLIPGGRRLSINALPLNVFAAPFTVNLYVSLPQADTYTLVVNQLTNFNFVDTYLNDTDNGTHQLLTLGSTYSFSLASGTLATSTRFSLSFEPNSNPLPLPVTLVAFTAEQQGADGLLHWATATEQNSAYFQPESSPDGTVFTPLGRVAGAGTTTQAHSYQFRDANLARYATGQVYYRLRQVDADGTNTFSPVRLLSVPISSFSAEAYPTTVLPGQALSLLLRTPTAGPAQLRITDATGRQVAQRNFELPGGASTTPLPEASRWAAGLYVLRIQQGALHQAVKVVIP